MTRHILLNSSGRDVEEAIAVLQHQPHVRLVDRTDDKALLIEASDSAVDRLRKLLPDWQISRETVYGKPSPPFPRAAWKPD
jgi:hypothetical protein